MKVILQKTILLLLFACSVDSKGNIADEYFSLVDIPNAYDIMFEDEASIDEVTVGHETIDFVEQVHTFDGKGEEETWDVFLIEKITPEFGPSKGMTTVTISGKGFVEGMDVWFGESKALYTFVFSHDNLNCSTPPHPPGIVDVKVVHPDGRESILPKAFRYESKVAISSVNPQMGSIFGGLPVVVKGAGFSDDTFFLFGGRSAIDVKIVDDETALMVTPPHEQGLVSVIVVKGEESAILKNAFEYKEGEYVEKSKKITLYSCNPSSGPKDGGTEIKIVGDGLMNLISMNIGAFPVIELKVLNDKEVICKTPPGSPGPTDIIGFADDGIFILKDGFEYSYEKEMVLAIEPNLGSWGGGTLVKIYGFGLDTVSGITFGDLPASDVSVKSSILITARSPRVEDVGPVQIKIMGTEEKVGGVQPLFYYYDPTLKGGGTWGGPINGATYVTVMSGQTGKPLQDAFVIIGNDIHTPFQGRTDDRGQITFSEFGLKGPITTTACKEGYSASTMVEYDALNMTIYLYTTPPPDQTGMPPSATEKQCLVKGRVKDFNKYLLKPKDASSVYVVCATTSSSMWGGNPDPGPKAICDEDGLFEIKTRSGQFSVVCTLMVVGDPKEPTPFPIKMGISSMLECAEPKTIENVEVSLSYDMDGELYLAYGRLPDYPDGVYGPSFWGAYNLGDEGYLDLLKDPKKIGQNRVLFRHQPSSFSGQLEGYGYSFYLSVSANSPNGMPYGVSMVQGVQPPQTMPLLFEDAKGFGVIETTISRPITAMISTKEGYVLMADNQGKTYWFNGKDIYLGPIQTEGAIYDLFGDSLEDFWAVGSGGAIWHVEQGKAKKIESQVSNDLLCISGLSAEDFHIAGGPVLLHFNGVDVQTESVLPDSSIFDIKRFSDGGLAVVGAKGLLLVGKVKELVSHHVTDLDLFGVDGKSLDDIWITGQSGIIIHVEGEKVKMFFAPTMTTLRGVYYRDQCDVIFYGDEGTIFRFDCKAFYNLSRADVNLDCFTASVFKDKMVIAGRQYVKVPNFLPFPKLIEPSPSVDWDGKKISWSFYESPQSISYAQLYLSGSNYVSFWNVLAGGDVNEVLLPDLGLVMGYSPIPKGEKNLNITLARTPKFNINSHSSSDLGYYKREAFSVGLVKFK